MQTVTEVTADTLNGAVEFDSPFRVNPKTHGYYTISTDIDVYGEVDVYHDPTNDVIVESDDWEALTGYTGQYGYNGAVMHPSEFIGGRLARDILDNPGVYVVVEVQDEDEGYPDGDPIGWAILQLIER